MTTGMNEKTRRRLNPIKLYLAIFLGLTAIWLAYFLLSIGIVISEREGNTLLSEVHRGLRIVSVM